MSEEQSKESKKKRRCYAHNHMNAKMWLVYTRAVTLSYNSGVFYFDGRKLAAEFVGVSKHTTYTGARQLKEKGWLIPLRPLKRLRNGLFASTSYRVLGHDEWAKLHPGQCRTFDEKEEGATEEQDNFDNKVGQAQADERSASNMELTSPSIRTGDAQESDSAVPQSGPVVPQNGTDHSLDPDQPFSQSGLTNPSIRTDQSLDPDIVSKESMNGEREGKESKGRGMGKGNGAASPTAPRSSPSPSGNPPCTVVIEETLKFQKMPTIRKTDSQLLAQFRKSSRSVHSKEFTSSDPDGWKNLVSRYEKRVGAILRWLKDEHQLSPGSREQDMFVDILLRVPEGLTDDELAIRPEGSLIQHAINEAMKEVSDQNINQLRFLLNTQFEDYRKTYTASRDEKLLESQPLGGVQ